MLFFKMLDVSFKSRQELGRCVWILQQAASSLLRTYRSEKQLSHTYTSPSQCEVLWCIWKEKILDFSHVFINLQVIFLIAVTSFFFFFFLQIIEVCYPVIIYTFMKVITFEIIFDTFTAPTELPWYYKVWEKSLAFDTKFEWLTS